MSVVFVQENKTAIPAGTGTVTSPTLTFTAGNNLVFVFYMFNVTPDSVSSITDTFSAHNTYNRLSGSSSYNANVFSGTAMEIWYSENVSGGSGTITATHLGGGGGGGMLIGEWSGLTKTSSFDNTNNVHGFASHPTLGVSLTNLDRKSV